MRRILVTAIGGDVGHSVLKCINKTENYIVGCDLVEYPVGIDLVDEYFISKKATDKLYIEDLIGKIQFYNITHIIVINETEIKVINQNRNLFEKYKILLNSKFIVETFLDKFETYKYLKSHNLGVPDTYQVNDKLPKGKQFILKLKNSSGSKSLKIFSEKYEIEDILTSNDDEYIIQEYIDAPDDEYTIGVFSNKIITNVIVFKRTLNGGYTKFVEYKNDIDIIMASKKIAAAVNLFGSINIQLRKLNGLLYIFEINPRLSGTTNFRRKLGFDDVNWWLDSLDFKNVPSYKPPFKKAIGIRELNEKFILIE